MAGGQFTHPDHRHENAQFISYVGERGFRKVNVDRYEVSRLPCVGIPAERNARASCSRVVAMSWRRSIRYRSRRKVRGDRLVSLRANPNIAATIAAVSQAPTSSW